MPTTLIAVLGEHPAVVTGMVKALRELHEPPILIERVVLLYPTDDDRQIEDKGVKLVCEHLEAQGVHVEPKILPFDDTRTQADSLRFLQVMYSTLLNIPESEEVYLSLAGGRKNLAALLGITAQFFSSVRGLFHLLDRNEERGRPIFPREEEMNLDAEDTRRLLDPPAQTMNLIRIPYPGAFAEAGRLRAFLQAPFSGVHIARLTPEARLFFSRAAGGLPLEEQVKVWATRPLVERYQRQGSPFAARFLMDFPMEMKEDRAVVYDPASSDREPSRPLLELRPQERVLIATLGKSPMVISQTLALLKHAHIEGSGQVRAVAVIHPQNPAICNGFEQLRRALKDTGIPLLQRQINGVVDIDSQDACLRFQDTFQVVTAELREAYPACQVDLSLSGGRKGMAALALLAAQAAGIDWAYHTVIANRETEKQVERETTAEALRQLSPDAVRRLLTLEAYEKEREHFQLFTVPLIPVIQ